LVASMDERLGPSRGAMAAPKQGSMLPEQHGLAMPEQVLWQGREAGPRVSTRAKVARWILAVLWLVAVTSFAWTLYRVLSVEAPTYLQIAFLVLSTLCFAWVAVGSATALVGFISLMWAKDRDSIHLPAAAEPSDTRTALLFPVYREDPDSVAVIIDTMCREILAADSGASFDIFVLSDTQDPEEREREKQRYSMLRRRFASRIEIYARWRTPNIAKKAGNIRDWVETFGGAYHCFIILDADSIMSADTMLRLVAAMRQNPQTGLIQTVPRLTGGGTVFARLQQFAGCYYGEILAAGLAAWQGRDGNYWGHNAIIRTAAFAQSAGLPSLKGRPPLGGHILSHDFVEAALLRRAGWEVHMAPSLHGSYEGCPPSLSDLIVRDRRWAQGNLQHLRLLGVKGLPFLSRLHLAFGACAYLASLMWALTILIGVVLAVQAKYATPTYFGSEVSLFPKWPVFDAQLALALFIATVVVVHVPKLLGMVWALRTSGERQKNGGVFRMIAGLVLESLASTVIAPILMVTQSSAVLSILMGRDAGWAAQRRAGAASDVTRHLVQHRWHLAWGVAAVVTCWAISVYVLAWMSPIIAGLLLAPFIAMWTSRQAGGLIGHVLSTTHDLLPPVLLSSHAAIAEERAKSCSRRRE
jgi:membrane glycosyltransferase